MKFYQIEGYYFVVTEDSDTVDLVSKEKKVRSASLSKVLSRKCPIEVSEEEALANGVNIPAPPPPDIWFPFTHFAVSPFGKGVVKYNGKINKPGLELLESEPGLVAKDEGPLFLFWICQPTDWYGSGSYENIPTFVVEERYSRPI